MLNPLRDNVVIEEINEEVDSPFVVPEGSKEKSQTAKVIAVGRDVKDVKVNDIVIYKKFSTTAVDKMLIIAEEDILCTKI